MRYGYVGVALAAVICSTSASAATYYESSVSAYSDGAPVAGQRYYIAPEKGLAQANGFEFAEYARHVERALSTKGMLRVGSADLADVVVFIGYGIGQPQTETGTYSVPEFGQTGTLASNTSGSISLSGNFNATTIHTPTYGITGYSQGSYKVTTYDRRLRMAAVDAASLRSGGTPKEKWRVDVQSDGTGSDLRALVPILAFSASTYIGTDTGRAMTVKVKEKSKDLAAFMAKPVSTAAMAE